MMKYLSALLCAGIFLITGCVSMQGYPKGVDAKGNRVYLGTQDIAKTEAFQKYLQTQGRETDKQQYLFTRLRFSENLSFFHDGAWYSALQAYRGGMWLMRHYYQPGQNTRDFIKEHVLKSDSGQYHLVKYPDGSAQLGAYILYNELDLLEEAAAKAGKK